LKSKNETLEERVAALTRANTELREQLGLPKEAIQGNAAIVAYGMKLYQPTQNKNKARIKSWT
jgi:hypothetical protein